MILGSNAVIVSIDDILAIYDKLHSYWNIDTAIQDGSMEVLSKLQDIIREWENERRDK